MSKFWGGVVVLLVVAVALLATANTDFDTSPRTGDIVFTDLETECRLTPATETNIRVDNRVISFEGHFQEDDPDARLTYRYRKTADTIRLNVISRGDANHTTFWNDCYGSVKYIANTGEIQAGEYTVTVQHNGNTVDSQIIRIR